MLQIKNFYTVLLYCKNQSHVIANLIINFLNGFNMQKIKILIFSLLICAQPIAAFDSENYNIAGYDHHDLCLLFWGAFEEVLSHVYCCGIGQLYCEGEEEEATNYSYTL
jgi:hypothetical protein